LDSGFQLLAGLWIPRAEFQIPNPRTPNFTSKIFLTLVSDYHTRGKRELGYLTISTLKSIVGF